MTSDPSEALDARAVLPEPLRVLLQDYPRDAWEADPNFSALIRFWLDRHLMFRRLMDTMRQETEATLDGAMEGRVFAQHLGRYGSIFLNDLHIHHNIEDTHFFPVLKVQDARIGRGFDILDRDHHAIDGQLERFAAVANAAIRAVTHGGDAKKELGAVGGQLKTLDVFLDRHLTDEEELVVPVLLKHAPEGLV